MRKIIMIGADVHDKNIKIRIGIDRDESQELTIRNTVKGLEGFFKRMNSLKEKTKADEIVLSYEAGPLGFNLYDRCFEAGITCYVLAPTNIAKSRKERKRKTDSYDAEKLLELLRGHYLAGNALPFIWVPDKMTRDDRELVRCVLDIGDKITRIKCQIQSFLKLHEIKKPIHLKGTWTLRYRYWLHSLTLSPGATVRFKSLMRQLESLEAEKKILLEDLKRLSESSRYERVLSGISRNLPGAGLLTVMVFLTEMGDLKRFKTKKNVGAYIGLVPNMKGSGIYNDRKGHITHQGPYRIRKVLNQAAWTRRRYCPQEQERYERIVSRNPQHKKIAIVAVMRQMAIDLWREGMKVLAAA